MGCCKGLPEWTQIAPSIDYSGSPFTITEGVEISTITPSNTGDSAFWSVSPSLPAGLGLSSSGEISGTPTLQVSAATYTITATNNGGSDTTTISLAVLCLGTEKNGQRAISSENRCKFVRG